MWYLTAFVARLFFFVLQLAAALGVLSTIAASQLEREASTATLRQVVTGRVCMPDGSPAVGAVVVTSAGGQAVTGAAGGFALTVEVPLDAESLEVTAVADEVRGSGSLVANARIVPAAPSRPLFVGKLVLSESESLACHTRWLPTFGERPGFEQALLALAAYDDGGGRRSTRVAIPPRRAAWKRAASRSGTARAGRRSARAWAEPPEPPRASLPWRSTTPGADRRFKDSVLALIVHDDGNGPALLAAGELGKRVAKWDGSSWLTIARGINSYVSALAIWDDGDGSALFAGGAFTASPAGDSYLAKRGCPEAKVKQRKL